MWAFRSKQPAARTGVLVVDDEQSILDLQVRLLSDAGYDVVTADDAAKALEIVRQKSDIDLIIADVHMPNMNGDEMARHVRAIRPELKILFVTGFADTLFANQNTLWDDQAYLDKPFTRKGLLEAVSLLLNGHITS